MDSDKKEVAAQKLTALNDLLNERREKDQEVVLSVLNKQEQALYLKAREYYARGSEISYGYDQRHIDFSTLIALSLCADADRNVVIPGIIFHDAGRYKTPTGISKVVHASFTQRLLHMFEGQSLVREHMAKERYTLDEIEFASQIVAVHDWPYVQKFNPDEELGKDNPSVEFNGKNLTLEKIYGQLLEVAESGILDTGEFRAYRDADRINVPTATSFIKDYLSRGGKYFNEFTPLEFSLLRFAYFGLFDEITLPEEITGERFNFINERAKLEMVSPGKATEVAQAILTQRRDNVHTGYLDLTTPLPTEQYKNLVHGFLDAEINFAQRFAQRE